MSKKYIKIAILIVFTAVFCFSSYMAFSEIAVAQNEAEAFSDIADSVAENRAAMRTADVGTANTAVANEPTAQEEAEVVQAEWYEGLLEQNGELFGWIEISGTNVNYPVMHTPNDPEKYLHTAFDGAYSKSGVPFMDASCFENCGNYIIYGHNMKNGSMFHDLLSYSDKAFYQSHPIIFFDTLGSSGDYEIIAAFRINISDADVFRYYSYTDLTDEALFDEYIAGVTAVSLYDTGKTAEFGDSLLTLSTCGKNNNDERFVVVAKRVG